MPKVRMKHRGGCAIGGSGIEWQASNITHPGIKNEDLPLAQIQIVADSSSLSLYVCFYFVDDFIAKFSRTIIGGCGECSAGTGQRAQVALDRAVPWQDAPSRWRACRAISTTFYFGAVNGGIWKTTDAGMVWTPIFDGQPVGSIGALAVAPSDAKTIYAGTGESDIRSSLSFGNGVYKSSDGGATWKHMGLDDTRHISRIVIDPQNADIVYVGALGHAYGPSAERGVYKSVDGGAHWARVLDLGPEIGISDLAICASAPQILFAGAWHTHRPPWSTYAPIDGPGSGLYRSQDGGKTWTRLEGNVLPNGDWGRVGVDVAPDGKRVYALIFIQAETQIQMKTRMQPETNIPATKSGLYRSDDGGNTWVLANSDARLTGRASVLQSSYYRSAESRCDLRS